MDRHSPSSIRRARALARVAGAITGVVVGVFYAGFIVSNSPSVFGSDQLVTTVTLAGSAVVGAAALALAAPLLTVEPYLWIEGLVNDAPLGQVLGSLAGVISGLLIAALIAALLSPLPLHIGNIVALGLAICLVSIGARAGSSRHQHITALLGAPRDRPAAGLDGSPPPLDGPPVVVDTSALIDGRVLDVARAGFLPGRLLIAGFVLEELQRVADAGDPARRAKGRRGLAVLEELQRRADVVCEMVGLDFPETPEVDTRLIRLATARAATLLTSDHNLSRVAAVAGVRVLNLNDLANALKPILSAGEQFSIPIVREGKELHQGVGYLDDGTMVVVENARGRLGATVRATVTSVLQTSSGRMIFASTEDPATEPAAPPTRLRAPRARAAHR